MKKMVFQPKKESNEEREKAFLALSPSERFEQFLKLCEAIGPFQNKQKSPSNNFVLEKKSTNALRK